MSSSRTALTYLKYRFHCNFLYKRQQIGNIYTQNVRNVHDVKQTGVSIVSVSEIKKQLRLGGYVVEDGFTCLITKCPVCKSDKKADVGNAYINKTTGFFLCPSCDASGQWSSLENLLKKKLGKQNPGQEPSDEFARPDDGFQDSIKRIVKNSCDVSELDDDRMNEVLVSFDLPTFHDAAKTLAGIRLSTDSQNLHFPLRNATGTVAGFRTISTGSSLEITEPRVGCSGVFWVRGGRGSGTVGKGNPAIIVDTASDALAIAAQKLQGGAICLPYGMASLPQEALPALEKWSKLVLWPGSEDCGHAMAVARKLGETRCLLVRPTEERPSPYNSLKAGLDLKAIAAGARPAHHKAITTFRTLREDVLSDLHNIDKVQGIKWKRYPALNRLLRGHRRGELTVLTGPTGCGKTTFCSEYSLDLAMQGVNTLWGSFEIRNARLARTMLQQMSGCPLEENLDKFDKFADVFEELPIYFMTFHGQQTIKDVMEAVEHAAYVHSISHVIIDNVQFMLGVGDEVTRHTDRFWKQDAVIAAFRGFATKADCHVTLVMHPRKERDEEDLSTSSIFGSAKASQEADNVLIIQDRRLTTVRGKKYLQVAKNRYSGDLGIIPMDFDKDSLSYAVKKKTPEKLGTDNANSEANVPSN